MVPSAEHGGQHGVLVAPQRGKPGGEVRAPDVQRDDLRELENGTKVVNNNQEKREKGPKPLEQSPEFLHILDLQS